MFHGSGRCRSHSDKFCGIPGKTIQSPCECVCNRDNFPYGLFQYHIGSKYSSYYNSFATILTLLGLALVIGVSIPEFGKVNLLETTEQGWIGVVAGGALIFFSCVGFEDLVKMAEETKSPKKNMPLAVMISGLSVLVIYVLIAISAVSVMGWQELSQSSGPLAAVIETKPGNGIGNAPNYAIFAVALVTMVFGLIGNLKTVASISNIFIFIVFGMVNIALINFR